MTTINDGSLTNYPKPISSLRTSRQPSYSSTHAHEYILLLKHAFILTKIKHWDSMWNSAKCNETPNGTPQLWRSRTSEATYSNYAFGLWKGNRCICKKTTSVVIYLQERLQYGSKNIQIIDNGRNAFTNNGFHGAVCGVKSVSLQ